MYEKNIIPLLTGDYPDPTIVEFREKFYMTHTAGKAAFRQKEGGYDVQRENEGRHLQL